MLTLKVDTVFLGSALSPLSVNSLKLVLFTVKGAVSPVIVNDITNGSVYANGCYCANSKGYDETVTACIHDTYQSVVNRLKFLSNM